MKGSRETCSNDRVIIESKNEKQLLNIMRMRDEEIRKALAQKSETEGMVSMMEKTVETYIKALLR